MFQAKYMAINRINKYGLEIVTDEVGMFLLYDSL